MKIKIEESGSTPNMINNISIQNNKRGRKPKSTSTIEGYP